MTRRLAKKMKHEWTRADLGERPRPRYTRDQLYESLVFGTLKPIHPKGKYERKWKYGRKR